MCHENNIRVNAISEDILEDSNSLKDMLDNSDSIGVENNNEKENNVQSRDEELKAITRKVERELKNELDPTEWENVELENGEIVSIRGEEKYEHKEWYGDDQYPTIESDKLKKVKQKIIDSLKIADISHLYL
jgi:hypothetical protein